MGKHRSDDLVFDGTPDDNVVSIDGGPVPPSEHEHEHEHSPQDEARMTDLARQMETEVDYRRYPAYGDKFEVTATVRIGDMSATCTEYGFGHNRDTVLAVRNAALGGAAEALAWMTS